MGGEGLAWRRRCLLGFLMMAIGACASGGRRGDVRDQGTEKAIIAAVPDALIQMRRNGCVGQPCPVYGLSIFLDGNVVYDGQANVRVVGRRTWRVPPDKIDGLISAFEEVDFLDTPERAGVCPDAQRTAMVILDYRPGRCEKTVIHDDRCPSAPSNLSRLEAVIDRLSGSDERSIVKKDQGSVALRPSAVR
jgi:hypothetical protein